MIKIIRLTALAALLLSGCVRVQPQIVVITATPTLAVDANTSQQLDTTLVTPIPGQDIPAIDPTPVVNNVSAAAQEYVVQPGDTLSGIAAANGVSLETLLSVNDLLDPNVLSVGQVINLPEPPSEQTNDFHILPDSRLVRGPGSKDFDVRQFIAQQPGYIHNATDIVDEVVLDAPTVVDRVSLEFSVDARLLLALLEYRSGWLSTETVSDALKTYPIQGGPSPDGFDRSGLYKQLAWTANQLNRGYYGWKYNGLSTIEFNDGTRLLYASGLNAATVGVQFFLSLNNSYLSWTQQVLPEGFYQVYSQLFGDPFANAFEPLIPVGLTQPDLTLPFTRGETWFFTGGPHGGWGTGSAWAAVDFAPPDDLPDGSPACYVSAFWATAVAPGMIVRSGGGVVILDVNGDGDESTGWTILYLHMASDGRVKAGDFVQPGDPIGHPSCEGGVSNGTHMHIGRRYNGEWLPVSSAGEIPPFVLGGWTMVGFEGQEYQGYMVNGAERRNAEQGRLAPDNRVSW